MGLESGTKTCVKIVGPRVKNCYPTADNKLDKIDYKIKEENKAETKTFLFPTLKVIFENVFFSRHLVVDCGRCKLSATVFQIGWKDYDVLCFGFLHVLDRCCQGD